MDEGPRSEEGERRGPALAEAFIRKVRGLDGPELRAAFTKTFLRTEDVTLVALTLDAVCARAEQAELAAREALVPVVDALQDVTCEAAALRLREEAAGRALLALERLVRQPLALQPARELPSPDEAKVPDYGTGRPLTLGERKSLARRPDRAALERLLRDPHPDVIRQLLANPRLTEDDVLAVAARRPARADVLTEIARSTRWSHRPRIRMALLFNPDTPLDVAGPIVGLLMRHELSLVATSPGVAPAVRALCLEHLARRPPSTYGKNGQGGGGSLQ